MSLIDKFAIACLLWLAGCGAVGLYLLHVSHSLLEQIVRKCV